MFEGFVFLCNCLMVFSEDLNVVEDTVLFIYLLLFRFGVGKKIIGCQLTWSLVNPKLDLVKGWRKLRSQ